VIFDFLLLSIFYFSLVICHSSFAISISVSIFYVHEPQSLIRKNGDQNRQLTTDKSGK